MNIMTGVEIRPIDIGSIDDLQEILRLCGEDTVVTIMIQTEAGIYEWSGKPAYPEESQHGDI